MTKPPPRTPADATRRRRAFARAHITDARNRGDIPTYGTPAWHQLPYADPRRWAAVIVAAEAWAQDGDDIPGRMRAELATDAVAEDLVSDEYFARLAAAARRLANRVPYAELQHRRGELTDEQLADHQRERTMFVSGRTDTPPRLPRSGAA